MFPGQGAQFSGMGKDLYESSTKAREMMLRANDILGFNLTDIMFEGSDEDLRATKVTQPAIFLHSVCKALCSEGLPAPDMVGGHSLGEFSALRAHPEDFEYLRGHYPVRREAPAWTIRLHGADESQADALRKLVFGKVLTV